MRKIFLIAGLIAFGFASAQENNLPTIEKYLKEQKREKSSLSPKSFIPYPPQVSPVVSSPLGSFSHELSNGNKVYSLPYDKMPCVVPEMSQFNMPCVIPDMSQFNMPCIKPGKQNANKPVLKNREQVVISRTNTFDNKK